MAFIATWIMDKMTHATDNIENRSAAVVSRPSGKIRSIRHHLLWCFLIITLVSLGVGCVLLADSVGASALKGQGLPDQALAFWKPLHWRIAIGILLIISAAGGVLYRLNRMIVRPLERTAAAAGRMAEGNLGETIAACACDEIDRIGEGVNSLSVNFQEALILVWNQTENALARIQRTTRQLAPEKAACGSAEMMADLTTAQQDLETMQMMVRSFDLYDVTITDRDMVTAKDKAEVPN